MSIQNLVRISTGEWKEHYVTDSGSVYPTSSLTRKGVPNAKYSPIGWMLENRTYLRSSDFAPYDAKHELQAAFIRQQIRDLQAQVLNLETSLMTLYRQKEQQP